jgi:hypothetical protein
MKQALRESGLLVLMCQTSAKGVIAGRRSEAEASPESMLPDLWLWIPGSWPTPEPRNDGAGFLVNMPSRSSTKPR